MIGQQVVDNGAGLRQGTIKNIHDTRIHTSQQRFEYESNYMLMFSISHYFKKIC